MGQEIFIKAIKMSNLDDSTSAAFRVLNHYAAQPMRCKKCGRVAGWIDNGICGSPKCNK